jgi:hypothetical protein
MISEAGRSTGPSMGSVRSPWRQPRSRICRRSKKTTAYQPQIDCYRKCVQEYYKNWKKEGCLYTEADGKTYFYYPYSAGGQQQEGQMVSCSAGRMM